MSKGKESDDEDEKWWFLSPTPTKLFCHLDKIENEVAGSYTNPINVFEYAIFKCKPHPSSYNNRP